MPDIVPAPLAPASKDIPTKISSVRNIKTKINKYNMKKKIFIFTSLYKNKTQSIIAKESPIAIDITIRFFFIFPWNSFSILSDKTRIDGSKKAVKNPNIIATSTVVRNPLLAQDVAMCWTWGIYTGVVDERINKRDSDKNKTPKILLLNTYPLSFTKNIKIKRYTTINGTIVIEVLFNILRKFPKTEISTLCEFIILTFLGRNNINIPTLINTPIDEIDTKPNLSLLFLNWILLATDTPNTVIRGTVKRPVAPPALSIVILIELGERNKLITRKIEYKTRNTILIFKCRYNLIIDKIRKIEREKLPTSKNKVLLTKGIIEINWFVKIWRLGSDIVAKKHRIKENKKIKYLLFLLKTVVLNKGIALSIEDETPGINNIIPNTNNKVESVSWIKMEIVIVLNNTERIDINK